MMFDEFNGISDVSMPVECLRKGYGGEKGLAHLSMLFILLVTHIAGSVDK